MIMQHIRFFPLFALHCATAAVFTSRTYGSETLTPPPNKESTAQVGEEMVHQGRVEQRAAIYLSEDITFGTDGEYVLTPGYYIRTGQSIGWETYAAADGPNAGRVRKAPRAITLQGSFLYSNDGETIAVITNFYQAIHAKAKAVTRAKRSSPSHDAIQRSLIYGGKSGTRIKVAYQEVWKNIIRPSRAQFIEYDLGDSKTVEIKGARIEVMEATSEHVRYRVIHPFDAKANRQRDETNH